MLLMAREELSKQSNSLQDPSCGTVNILHSLFKQSFVNKYIMHHSKQPGLEFFINRVHTTSNLKTMIPFSN